MNQSILFNPNSDAVFYSRASIRGAMTDFEGAIADYSRVIQLNPAHAQAYTDRAAAYSIVGKVDAARVDIAHAAKLRPNDPKVVFVQGRIEMQAGNKPAGCALMQQAVNLGLKEAAAFVTKNCAGISESAPGLE